MSTYGVSLASNGTGAGSALPDGTAAIFPYPASTPHTSGAAFSTRNRYDITYIKAPDDNYREILHTFSISKNTTIGIEMGCLIPAGTMKNGFGWDIGIATDTGNSSVVLDAIHCHRVRADGTHVELVDSLTLNENSTAFNGGSSTTANEPDATNTWLPSDRLVFEWEFTSSGHGDISISFHINYLRIWPLDFISSNSTKTYNTGMYESYLYDDSLNLLASNTTAGGSSGYPIKILTGHQYYLRLGNSHANNSFYSTSMFSDQIACASFSTIFIGNQKFTISMNSPYIRPYTSDNYPWNYYTHTVTGGSISFACYVENDGSGVFAMKDGTYSARLYSFTGQGSTITDEVDLDTTNYWLNYEAVVKTSVAGGYVFLVTRSTDAGVIHVDSTLTTVQQQTLVEVSTDYQRYYDEIIAFGPIGPSTNDIGILCQMRDAVSPFQRDVTQSKYTPSSNTITNSTTLHTGDSTTTDYRSACCVANGYTYAVFLQDNTWDHYYTKTNGTGWDTPTVFLSGDTANNDVIDANYKPLIWADDSGDIHVLVNAGRGKSICYVDSGSGLVETYYNPVEAYDQKDLFYTTNENCFHNRIVSAGSNRMLFKPRDSQTYFCAFNADTLSDCGACRSILGNNSSNEDEPDHQITTPYGQAIRAITTSPNGTKAMLMLSQTNGVAFMDLDLTVFEAELTDDGIKAASTYFDKGYAKPGVFGAGPGYPMMGQRNSPVDQTKQSLEYWIPFTVVPGSVANNASMILGLVVPQQSVLSEPWDGRMGGSSNSSTITAGRFGAIAVTGVGATTWFPTFPVYRVLFTGSASMTTNEAKYRDSSEFDTDGLLDTVTTDESRAWSFLTADDTMFVVAGDEIEGRVEVNESGKISGAVNLSGSCSEVDVFGEYG